MFNVLKLEDALKSVLKQRADEAALDSGWKQRKSGVLSGSVFVQALMLGWLRGPAASLGELSQTAAALGARVSGQGIDKRFNKAAADMMRMVLDSAVQQVVTAEAPAIELLRRFSSVEVGDSSTIALPAELEHLWAGCGGNSGQGLAALKLHVMLDLRNGRMRGPFLTPGRSQDKVSPLQQEELEPGSLRIMDLGFFVLEQLQQLSEQGVNWLSRLQVQTAVFDENGERLDLSSCLPRQGAPSLEISVRLGLKSQLQARLLAVRVPPEVCAERRRRLYVEAKKKGQTPSQRRLALCDWTILVTNAAPELLSVEEALVLLRARWQIELLFKLWKQHGLLDESRSSNPWRILCELYAKLLALLLQHWCCVTALWDLADRSLVKAAQTLRDSALLLAAAFRGVVDLRVILEQICSTLALGCHINRRKQHPNTYQLLHDPMLNPHLPAPMDTAMAEPAAA